MEFRSLILYFYFDNPNIISDDFSELFDLYLINASVGQWLERSLFPGVIGSIPTCDNLIDQL